MATLLAEGLPTVSLAHVHLLTHQTNSAQLAYWMSIIWSRVPPVLRDTQAEDVNLAFPNILEILKSTVITAGRTVENYQTQTVNVTKRVQFRIRNVKLILLIVSARLMLTA